MKHETTMDSQDSENLAFIRRLGFEIKDMRDLEAGNFDISGLFPTNLMEIVRADKDLNSIVHSLLTENKIFSIPQISTGPSEWNGDPDDGSLTEEAKLAELNSNMDISKMAVEG